MVLFIHASAWRYLQNGRFMTEIELKLLQITQEFLLELKSEQASRALTLNASLEKDLGLGSLERVELTRRIENVFAIQLALESLEKIVVLQDFIALIERAQPSLTPGYVSSRPLDQSKIDPKNAKTLVELLEQYSQLEPDRPHIFFQNEKGEEEIISYGKLAEKARGAAAEILGLNIKPKETVAIMLPTSQEFFFVFFGILLAGAIPVPIYPPTQIERIEEYVLLQAKVLKNADIRLLITLDKGRMLSQVLKSFLPNLRAVITIEDINYTQTLNQRDILPVNPEDIALIQYTSGSTGDPKGVVLTHQNVLSNIRAIGQSIQIRPTDFMVSWLPLYHDMGLIGAWLGSLYFGTPVCIFSPLIFLVRPERWLWAMHYHRATITGAPNFAYELCANAISNEKLAGLDLSALRLTLSGAETIQATTIRKFTKKFSPYHFDPKAMAPGYGLAESTMGLIFSPLQREPKIDLVERDTFMKQGKAMPAKTTDKFTLEIVSCGFPLSDHQVRIVDENEKNVEERRVGSLQFKGPSNMKGYYKNPQATEKIVHDGWIDSGDLAYQAEGEIYIAGRKKDIIISAGRNIYPEEIEKISATVPGVIWGCVIAFGLQDPQTGTEQCIIVAETEEKDPEIRKNIMHSVKTKVALATNITPNQVVLVTPHTVPKTPSGKVQRSACKQAYLQNRLSHPKKPLWLQMTKLMFTSAKEKTTQGLFKFGRFFYTIYAWLIAIITIIPVWVMLLFSNYSLSASLISGWAKFILKLIFCPLKVKGNTEFLQQGGMILTCNHASYLDAIVLLAALPKNLIFVAKQELIRTPIASIVIRKLHYILVKRLDIMDSVQNTSLILQKLEQGHSVLIFPEGTFTYATGLRAFKMGAFKLAVEFKIPICPMGLQGTRKMFRGNQWLLAPTKLTLDVGSPVIAEGHGWEEAARLRDLIRKQIAERCGERQIDLVSAKL